MAMNKDQSYLDEIAKTEEIDYISRLREIVMFTHGLEFDTTVLGIHPDIWNCYLANPPEVLGGLRSRFNRAVDHYSQLCGRTEKLYSFKVSFELGHESACHIDRWISFVVETKIERLELKFGILSFEDFVPYNFPCHLLLPTSDNQQSALKHLCLHFCALSPSSPDYTGGLNSLKILELYNVYLDESAFNNIRAGCRNLEQFRLGCCTLPRFFVISGHGGFHHLKRLTVNQCYGVHELEVSYINLTMFEYTGVIFPLSIVGVGSLEKVHIDLEDAYDEGTDYIFNTIAKAVPELQTLSLSLPTHQVPLPAKMTVFSHLKQLVVGCPLACAFDLVSLTSFLDAFPCLQKLRISLNDRRFNGKSAKRDYPLNLHYHLKEVEISGYHDQCNLVDLSMHLLKSAVALECMIFDSRRCWKFHIDIWRSSRWN